VVVAARGHALRVTLIGALRVTLIGALRVAVFLVMGDLKALGQFLFLNVVHLVVGTFVEDIYSSNTCMEDPCSSKLLLGIKLQPIANRKYLLIQLYKTNMYLRDYGVMTILSVNFGCFIQNNSKQLESRHKEKNNDTK
jgi:hypothetical protein